MSVPFLQIDLNVLHYLTDTLKILSKTKEVSNYYEIFNAFLLKNILNFPAKSQGFDNTISIFNEDNFHFAEEENLLIKLKEETKLLFSPSSDNNSTNIENKKRQSKNALRRASSLKKHEDELISSPSPRAKNVMKKNSNVKYMQFVFFYKEKRKLDKINNNISGQNISGLFTDNLMISFNQSHILSFVRTEIQPEEKINIISI